MIMGAAKADTDYKIKLLNSQRNGLFKNRPISDKTVERAIEVDEAINWQLGVLKHLEVTGKLTPQLYFQTVRLYQCARNERKRLGLTVKNFPFLPADPR